MTTARVAIAAILTAMGLFALAVASATNVGWHASDASALRISLSARPERIEACRTLTAEELAARPAHMRLATECTGRFATYELVVGVDEGTPASEIVEGGGIRRDRPLHLLRAFGAAPGLRRVRVSLRRREEVTDARPQDGERALAALPPLLELDTLVRFVPGRVILVSYDPTARSLVVR